MGSVILMTLARFSQFRDVIRINYRCGWDDKLMLIDREFWIITTHSWNEEKQPFFWLRGLWSHFLILCESLIGIKHQGGVFEK